MPKIITWTLITAPLVLGMSLGTGMDPAQAELYRWTDEQGRVHYSDKKSSHKATEYTPETRLSTYRSSGYVLDRKLKPREDFSDLPPYEQRRETADIDQLYAVKFPTSPSTASVAAYIQKIYAISRLQKRHLRSDPQVSLLMQVGPEYLHVLIRETYSHVGWHDYGIEAIKKLATEEHKKLIFNALKTFNKYSSVIYINGWHHEIQQELIKGLRNNRGYVPSEWIKAVAEFEREDAREVLIEYFKYGWNNHSTYNHIAGIKGIEPRLKAAIPEAWETARRDNKYALGMLTPKALELGYMPAFRFVMVSLLDNASRPKHEFDAHSLAITYTVLTGNAREILSWYENNQRNIVFDAARKRYVVKS